MLMVGCTRSFYRDQADRDSYGAIQQRNHDPRWQAPYISVDASPQSRFYDPFNPNRPPLPPDDPAAARYMRCADGRRGYLHWHRDGDAPWIEDPDWINTLGLNDQGVLNLTPEKSVELGIINSREYQMQLEDLYLPALSLTLARFQFDLQWTGTNDTTYERIDNTNNLTTTSNLGFTKLFTAGGQLMVDFANSFIFTFSGTHSAISTSNIVVTFLQPLLQNGGRDYVMEPLTEAERQLLYQLRIFAQYRKGFTFNVATSTYLNILLQEQRIRNDQATLKSYEQNLRLHESLFQSGEIANVKVDQALQSLQSQQATLVQDKATLETELDQYKLVLGLPPRIGLHLDDKVLAPFLLSDPDLDRLQAELDPFVRAYRELNEAPPVAKLEDGFGKLKTFHERLAKLVQGAGIELERWKADLAQDSSDKDQMVRRRAAWQARARDLDDIRTDLAKAGAAILNDARSLGTAGRENSWLALQKDSREVDTLAASLFVLQNQVRVYLIKLKPVPFDQPTAIKLALENRLDLMNQRAQVVDAWRQIDVTANQLEAQLNLVAGANLGTQIGRLNPVAFTANNSTFSAGVQFNAPLNRYAQRNNYRSAQITYEQARRTYMQLEDQIQIGVRQDLRNLETARLNFEINRQLLITTARQVEALREDLVLKGKDAPPTATVDLLNALNSILTAKNTLIANWVTYQTTWYQLLLDMDVLQVDERGLYVESDYVQPVNQ
jgi:outer membrane protein TolC